MQSKNYVTIDGNEAVAYVAYRVNEVMARDGENSKERSNKLMRMRVMFQGAAIALFAIAMLAGS